MPLFLRIHCVALLLGAGAASAAPIILDGAFEDWNGLTVAASDATGDAGSSGVDFEHVWASNDDHFFFLRFQTTVELQGDEQQSLRLYLDGDMNAATGTAYDGIGADLVWDFGQRSGNFRGNSIGHDDVGMLLGPTVSDTQFEIALRLDATPVGATPLFSGSQLRFILRDMASAGDRVPNSGAITATIAPFANDDPSLPLGRLDAAHLRVASYNVLNDGLFEGGAKQAAYQRLLNAIDADVFVFNEVWDHSADQTRDRVQFLLGESGWSAVKLDSGNVIASRYPIVQSWTVLAGARLTAARIDLNPDHDRDVLVIAAHLSCCTADLQRQEQVDALIAFLRDAKTPGGLIDLPQDTPIVAAGDFNLVGWRQQLDTILSGDIQDEGRFGVDHAPDWDGSDFDVPPSTHSDLRVGYTWFNPSSSFLPGLLDFIFVTQSVVELGNHYILDTRTMRPATLAANGLSAGDSGLASDHCPRVADLVLETAVGAPSARRFELHAGAPNPFNPRTTLRFEIERAGHVRLDVVDPAGRHVRALVDDARAVGSHEVVWDGRDDAGRAVAGGVYFVRLRAGTEMAAQKLTLVK